MNPIIIQWAITFQWEESGKLKNQQISKGQVINNNHNGDIIIGRDSQVCDLVINNNSVSAQHIMISFKEEQQKFFIKSLNPQNISNLNGQNIDSGKEFELLINSIIFLGKQRLQIIDIQIYQLPSTDYSGILPANTNSIPAPQNLNLNELSSSSNTSHTTKLNSHLNETRFSWKEPTIIVAIIGGIATIVSAFINLSDNIIDKKSGEIKVENATKYKEIELNKKKQQYTVKTDKETQDTEYLKVHQEQVIKQTDKPIEEVRQEKGDYPYRRLNLKNENCPNPVKVAFSFTGLDNISKTQGWFIVNRELKPIPLDAEKTSKNIYLYAKTKYNGTTVIWKPQITNLRKRLVSDSDFNYIDRPNNDKNKDNKKIVEFYEVQVDDSKEVTNRVFKCTAGKTLDLVNADEKS
ncbi:FHA domain-containing protein [Sphaerospermopsis torques-reginae]|uniref:FHA domain-containing protein n=1 Tax=Sphaerospermopsis torques-reginae ITEP-024 TaxID=984208 RepID=A0ABX8X0M4_9CYAN|nr:FHA domain-containing protein [Sphaerospermopsis torques-reginae]QYX32185.1 FHA domain-containing protein [Sphaerospermopsis torques-reginae ITEP-024]